MTDENVEKVSIKSNPALIFFNDQIVNLKPIVKAVKVNECQKIVRKIKQLNTKKGNEAQLEKNKRKCENLKKEIDHIKTLKFNDVAMFNFENEEETLAKYIAKHKTISIDEIGLARVAFNKKLVDGIAKIKANKKLEDWKATFIQYKARCEKRKSWKDKVSQMKEIENKLALLNENDSDAETEATTKTTTTATKATKTDDSTEKQKTVEKTTVESKPKKDLKEPIETKKVVKMDSDNNLKVEESLALDLKEERDSEDEETEDSEDNDDEGSEKSYKQMDLDYEMGGFSDEDDAVESSGEKTLLTDLIQPFKVEKRTNKEKDSDMSQQQKPLVVQTKKTNKMLIKQFNMDEIKDCNEIPVQEESGESEADADSDEDSYQGIENTKKFDIKVDPFFLDDNGNEIVNEELDRERERYRNRRREEANNMNFGSYSSYDRYKEKREGNQDDSYSFKRKFNDHEGGSEDRKRGQFDRRSGGSLEKRSFGSRDSYQTRNGDSQKMNNRSSFSKPRTNSHGQNNNSYNTTSYSNTNRNGATSEKNIHPSWAAKKQMEERSKMKFVGKKMTFDD